MNGDLAELKFWFDVAGNIAWVVVTAYLAYERRHRVTTDKIVAMDSKMTRRLEDWEREHEARCSNHHQRTATLEVTVRNAPTHRDLGEIHEKINAVHGLVKEFSGQLSGLNRNVSLIHEYLLKEKGQ
ncbi:MAG: DUF2730 family protein [Thermodesulfobacteriota bacterium]